jgi:4-carboxymuconolactone decarboxylase
MAFSDHLDEKGKATSLRLFGDWQRPNATDVADEEFQELVANFVVNGLYSREVISPKVRQLIAVACLTVAYRPEQLRSHIRAALRLAEPAEVREAIIQACVYGGMPAMASALRIYGEVAAESSADQAG